MDIRKFFHKRLKVDHSSEVENHQIVEGVEKGQGPAETEGDFRPLTLPPSTSDSHQSKTTSSEPNNGSLDFPSNISAPFPLPSSSTQTQPKSTTDNSFDIVNYLNENPKDDLKYLFLTNTDLCKPHDKYNFKNDVTDNKRPFRPQWLSEYNWLTYSEIAKGAFCKLCVLFKPRVSHGSYQGGFITRPFNNYKKFHESAKSHAGSSWHQESVEKSTNFLSIMKRDQKSIDVLVNEGLAQQIEANRKKIKPILSSILFCALHDLPLRGKTDEHAVFNDLLKFREESGDITLADHLKNAPKNATYISHRIQNELIEISATVLRHDLIEKVKSNEVFSILADETMDTSGTEQLSLGVRYFDKTENCIKEDFLGFTPLKDGLDAETVANAITSTLKTWGLNLNNAVGQGYDGCSTMAGHVTGVQKRINDEYPMALFFHCSSHRLNLSVHDSNTLPQIRNTVGTIKEAIKFFRENGQRREIIGTLQTLCETRWTEKYKSIRKFNNKFVDIMQALEKLSTDGNKDTRQKAFQLHCAFTTSTSLICLQIIAQYSEILEVVSQLLQSPSVDLLRVSNHIQHLISTFETHREESVSEFDKIMKTVEKNAEVLGISISKPRVVQKQTHRANQPAQTINEYYRLSIYLPYLDSLIQSLKDRFSVRHQAAFEIFKLHPREIKRISKEDYEKSMQEAGKMYSKLLDNFQNEVTVWYTLWKNTKTNDEDLKNMHLLDVLQHEHTHFLPAVAKCLQIALCLPPTTCTIERSFR